MRCYGCGQIDNHERNDTRFIGKKITQSVSLREATVQDRAWYFVDLGFFKDKERAQSYATLLQKKKVISAYFIRGDHDEDQKN